MDFNILDKPLLKALLDEHSYFHDIMNAHNIRVTVESNLDYSVLGFVYLSTKDNYHLIINGNMNYETQCKTFLHEIKHIVNDMPNIGYMIGLDMQYTLFESEADKVAEGISNY